MGAHSANAKIEAAPAQRTWGSYLLMILSFVMLAGSVALFIYCLRSYMTASEAIGETTNSLLAIGLGFYALGIGISVPVIIPAALGIITFFKPKASIACIVLAIIALVVVVAALVYFVAVVGATVFSVVLYGVIFAIAPVLYLVAACKVRRAAKG